MYLIWKKIYAPKSLPIISNYLSQSNKRYYLISQTFILFRDLHHHNYSSAAFTAGAIDSMSCPLDASCCSPFVPRHLWFVPACSCVLLYVHREFWSSGGAHDFVKLLSYHSSAMRLLDLSLNTVYGLQVWVFLFFSLGSLKIWMPYEG